MTQLITDLITTNLKAQLNGKQLLPLNIRGDRGLGKTSTVRSIAAELNAAFLDISLPAKSLEYFSGLPQFIPAPHMQKYSVSNNQHVQGTMWTVPELIATANRLAEEHGSCIMLLDDFHELTKSTEPIMYELLLERKVGDFRLHPKVAIITAMNETEASGGGSIKVPIKDRLSMIKAEFDFKYWYPKFGNKLHYLLASFLKLNEHLVMEEESTTLESSASPRAWSFFSNELETHSPEFISKHIYTIAQQYISADSARVLQKHLAYMEAIDFTGVVKSKQLMDIQSLSVTDQFLWAYIINFITDVEDIPFYVDLINKNQHVQSFIGAASAELATRHSIRAKGHSISKPHSIIIDKFLKRTDFSEYKLTDKQSKLITEANFSDTDNLHTIAAKYLM